LHDPFSADLDERLWLRHIGDGHIISSDRITEENTGMSASLIEIIKNRRSDIHSSLGNNDETLVWISKKERNLASIANKKWVDPSIYYRLSFPPLGIFGRFEQMIGDLVFINPYTIWHVRQNLR
jgi:hypothetical protein